MTALPIADLTAAMGITPQKLLRGLRSKAELYRETLDQYRRMPRPEPGNPFLDKLDTVTAFERFLTNSARIFTAFRQHPKGCMISTAVAELRRGKRADRPSRSHRCACKRLTSLTARIERGIVKVTCGRMPTLGRLHVFWARSCKACPFRRATVPPPMN